MRKGRQSDGGPVVYRLLWAFGPTAPILCSGPAAQPLSRLALGLRPNRLLAGLASELLAFQILHRGGDVGGIAQFQHQAW